MLQGQGSPPGATGQLCLRTHPFHGEQARDHSLLCPSGVHTGWFNAFSRVKSLRPREGRCEPPARAALTAGSTERGSLSAQPGQQCTCPPTLMMGSVVQRVVHRASS